MSTFDLSHLQVDWHHNGTPLKIRGEIDLPKVKSVESAISKFLIENSKKLKFNIDPATLHLVHKATTPIREVFRYEQVIDDIPVFNSYVIVQTDFKSKIKQLDFGHVNDVKILNAGKGRKITAQEAYAVAQKSLQAFKIRGKKIEPSLIYYPTPKGLHLSYLVLILTQDSIHDWRIIVDAFDKTILKKDDIIKNFPDGSGFVFDPNPVVTANNNTYREPAATLGTCGYNGTAVATLDAQRVTRALKGLKFSGGVYSLDGPYAKIINIASPSTTIPTEAVATAFNYSQSDDRLGAVNLYYHIDTIQRYIQSLGITTANNRQTNADPVVSGTSAYYSPVNKSLHMGSLNPCGPDKCQEGDAIVHEYGHAIQDNQVPGWGVTNPITHREETGAMGEGFGDILACVFFANAGNQYQREVFEDWAYSYNGSAALRRVDGTKIYPTDWASEVHDDGEIWSAALWNIYRNTGGDSLALADRQAARDALLKTVIISHHLLAIDASMPDGAEAIMTTNAELDEYRGKHLIQMLNSFHDRGILKCNASADLWMHDAASDTGTEPFAGSVFWESPDVWVRKSDDGLTTPEEPEVGQDNYFYARVTNRGTVTARAFVVTFNVKPWAGTQFVYAADFVPCVSAAVGFNLAPGASTIVKAKWPASMIPVAGTHSCLLGQVYTPVDVSPVGSHVWNKNNLAQRNMTVEDAIPGDTVYAWFQIGNIHERFESLYNLEVARPPRWHDVHVSLVSVNNYETKRLFNSAKHWKPEEFKFKAVAATELVFTDYTNVEVVNKYESSAPLRFNLSPGSSITQNESRESIYQKVEFQNQGKLIESGHHSEIELMAGKMAGLPVFLPGSTQIKCGLKITVPTNAKEGDELLFRVAQRNTKGQVVGGISVQVNVKSKKEINIRTNK